MGIPNASGTYYLDASGTNNAVLALNGGVSNANTSGTEYLDLLGIESSQIGD